MNAMEEIFEIRNCMEILSNDINVNTAMSICYIVNRELQGVYILGDLHPFGGKDVLNMYDLFIRYYSQGTCPSCPPPDAATAVCRCLSHSGNV